MDVLRRLRIFAIAVFASLAGVYAAQATPMQTYYDGLISNPFIAGPYVYSRNAANGHSELVIAGVDTNGDVVDYGVYDDLGRRVTGATIAPMPMNEFRDEIVGTGTSLSTGAYCGLYIVCDPSDPLPDELVY